MAHHVIGWQDEAPAPCRGAALAIGNFDGAHRGHAVLVSALAAAARARGVPAVVLTFDPHPLAILRPQAAPVLLTAPDDRASALHALGADEVLALRTDAALLDLPAAAFFDRIVRRMLAASALCEGPNFGFGRGREGDVALLGRLCAEAGMSLAVVPRLAQDGQTVSSSRIRQSLLAGDAAEAARLLGRPYRLRGIVGQGQRRGRTLGFPTANLEQTRTVLPGEGVYAALATAQGRAWPAAVNIGPNPTFGEAARKIEAHLIGFAGDLYGQPLALDFQERLRGTRSFAGADELSEQLRQDVAQARRIAERSGG